MNKEEEWHDYKFALGAVFDFMRKKLEKGSYDEKAFSMLEQSLRDKLKRIKPQSEEGK